MNDFSITRLYDLLRQDLIGWVRDNKKLGDKISGHNLDYLFEFNKRKGLSVDLCRFEKAYYEAVFYPPEDKQEMIAEFVRKVCLVIQKSLKRIGMAEISLTVTVRHRVSVVSHWRTFYISEGFDGKGAVPLLEKKDDWA